MAIEDLIPILVPGIMIQVCIQAFYIKHCWENKELTQKQKALYIIIIAFFNLAGAAIYMFLRGSKQNAYKTREIKRLHIDNGAKQGIFIMLIIAYEAISINMAVNGPKSEKSVLTIALTASVFILVIISGLFIKPRHRFLYYTLPAAQIILSLIINYLEYNTSSQIIIFVVMAVVINNLSLNESKIYALSALLLYFGSSLAKLLAMGITDQNILFGGMYLNLVVFVLIFAAFYSVKKQLLMNQLLQKALAENEEKSLKLEEMGAVAERNRIAAEIHDNVGHKLTAAIITVEAGEKLLEKDSVEAQKKLALARQQIKEGLQNIRLSVKAIKQGEEKPFSLKLSELLDQIRKDTQLQITDIIELKTELLPIQQSVLLQAIVECATNSIKHGKSTKADILIQQHKDMVSMTFSDNGKGSEAAVFGFGLSNMSERVRSIGGELRTESASGEGFTVTISIPAGKEEK